MRKGKTGRVERLLRGVAEIRITGAAPWKLINACCRERITVEGVESDDLITCRALIFAADAERVKSPALRLRRRGAVRARAADLEEASVSETVGSVMRSGGRCGNPRLVAFCVGYPRDGERFRYTRYGHIAHAGRTGRRRRELLAVLSGRAHPLAGAPGTAGAQLAGGERARKHGERGGARRGGKAGDHRSAAGRGCDGVALGRYHGGQSLLYLAFHLLDVHLHGLLLGGCLCDLILYLGHDYSPFLIWLS